MLSVLLRERKWHTGMSNVIKLTLLRNQTAEIREPQDLFSFCKSVYMDTASIVSGLKDHKKASSSFYRWGSQYPRGDLSKDDLYLMAELTLEHRTLTSQ